MYLADPEAARIGLTPDEAAKQYKDMHVVRFPWAEIDRAQAEGETTGFIKLVLAGRRMRLSGCISWDHAREDCWASCPWRCSIT